MDRGIVGLDLQSATFTPVHSIGDQSDCKLLASILKGFLLGALEQWQHRLLRFQQRLGKICCIA